MTRRITLAIALLSTASAGLAQVSAPQLGWVPDRASIRPVYGIPAAGAVGARVRAQQDFSRIAVSPARNYVLMSATKTGTVFVYTPESGLIPLEGASGAPDQMVLSPRGSAAVLWSGNRAQVVTGLPDAPMIRTVDASFLQTAPSALAISDDGSWLAQASSEGVYAFGPNGDVKRLALENAAALAFFQGTHALAVAGADGVRTVTGLSGFAVVSNLLLSADASLQPVAVATTEDNRTLIVADRSGAVSAVDIGSGAVRTSNCGCRPEGLFGMGPSAFRLTDLRDGAFKLFDAARVETLFVPIALPAGDGAGQ